MKVTITDDEWRIVLRRAREVGEAMGAERVAIVAARAALEAMGVTVPVIADEMDMPAGPPRAAVRDRAPAIPVGGGDGGGPGGGGDAGPPRDLRRAARTAAPAGLDGYCAHCDSVYGAAAIAVLPDGNRLCPVHGTVVHDITEVAEGRFSMARQAGQPRRAAASGDDTDALCGAPVGGRTCTRDVGHQGRHGVRRRGQEGAPG
jgi:hypothetical protein